MTHQAPSQDTDKNQCKPDGEKEKTPFWRNELCNQSCAAILLTIGLCIIVFTFYLALQEKHELNFNPNFKESNNEAISAKEHIDNSGLEPVPNNKDDFLDDANTEDWLDTDINGRLKIEQIFGSISQNLIGCQEKLCKIVCSNDVSLFSSLYKTMHTSACPTIDILLVESQEFSKGVLKNSWLPMNRSIHEVIIRWSNLTKIKGNAFNSPIFTNTLLMSWSKLNIDRVESGALLGLYKLKYLTIDSNIRTLEAAVFQPVQTTLTHLKLNGNLELDGNRNPFGLTDMINLEYMDLSHNHINGSLGRRMFSSTPNLRYLIMVDAQLQRIKPTAFAKLSEKLIFLNLSKNLLTTLAPNAIQPIVQHQMGAMLSLSHNKWICDCDLQELSELYTNYRNKFMDAVYCTAPHYLYGKSIDEVNYEQQKCGMHSTTVQGPVEEKDDNQTESTKSGTTKLYSNTPPMDIDSSELIQSGEITSAELQNVLIMRCVNTEPTSSAASSSSSSSASSSSTSSSSSSTEELKRNVDDTVLKFPAAEHEFDLQLIAENNSVKISIANPSDIMIIWFSEQQETASVTFNDMSVDYECMRYAQPNLIVGPLVENTTYTFCLIPRYQSSISPFNCLPLHVPMKREENIWISQDNKQFTIGMLCLIFFVSTIVGALVAYFGIRTYPDLLEGSKNVLVVKKPEQACYVATISETEYTKHSPLKNRKPSTMEGTQIVASKEANHKKAGINLPLPATPTTVAPKPPTSLVHTPLKNLESVSSGISTATCFEDSFPDCLLFQQDDYETPKVCENIYTLEQRMVPNNYGMSPTSPPPLPKRNSNISDSPTVIMNRFSRNM